MTSHNNTVQNAERNLNYVLLLKNSLDIVPELREALGSGRALFFTKVRKVLFLFKICCLLISLVLQTTSDLF